MTKTDILTVNPQELARAWSETLPLLINPGDKATVVADERDANVLRIHIDSEGRSMYSFDFKCTYVDAREVKVEVIDAERGHDQTDERSEIVQSLIEDYVRHIHECAQRLKGLTNA